MKLFTLFIFCTLLILGTSSLEASVNFSTIHSETIFNNPIKPAKAKKKLKRKKLRKKKSLQADASSKSMFLWGGIFLVFGVGNLIYILLASSISGGILYVFVGLAAFIILCGIYDIIRGIMLKKQGY